MDQDQLNQHSIPPEEKAQNISAPEKKKPSLLKRILVIIGLVFAGSTLVVGFLGYKAYKVAKEEYEDRKRAYDNYQKALQASKEAYEKPRKEMMAKIDDVRQHGTALPPCPLIFPLLNEKGKLTPLGSFLSVFAMEKATYLPQSVFQLNSELRLFYAFGLFRSDNYYQENYKTQLPLLFGTKDCGEGTLIQNKNGYRIHLRFSGSHPEKVFDKKFPKKRLHLAPIWMAACLQEWVGFHPTKSESDYMADPIYKTDDHLIRNALLQQVMFQGGDILVTRWEEILADASDCPCLFPTWVGILDAKEGVQHLDMVKTVFDNNPEGTCINDEMISEYYYQAKYDAALKLAFPQLKRDENNMDWYGWVVYSLEYKNFWEEAVQLVRDWTQKYPQNPSAWYVLSNHLRLWGRPLSESDKLKYPHEAEKSLERLKEGMSSAKKVTELSPKDERGWSELLYYGKFDLVDKKTMEVYFNKAISLNPNDYSPFQTYLSYLKSHDSDDYKESHAFALKYSKKFPALVTDVDAEFITLPCVDTAEAQKNRLRQMSAKMKKSPYWPEFKKYIIKYLERNPGDVGEWKVYLQWADLVGQTDDVFNLAKKISKKDPELKALYPYVVLFYPTEALKNRATDQEKVDLWTDASLVKKMGEAYREITKLDPRNWHNLNLLAEYDVKNGFEKEGRRIFRKIGNHWAPEVWSKEDFDKAKASFSTSN